jgi:ribosomal protein S18 acetylase RimI-like enzyme
MSDWPSAQDLQIFHYRCLQRMYFDEMQSVSGGYLLLSQHVRDSYYNYFGATAETTIDQVRACESKFASRDRSPAVYVGPQVASDTQAALLDDGYAHWATDAWLGTELDRDVDVSLPSTVVLAYLEPNGGVAYLDAFREAYSGGSGEDAYGDLDEGYTQALGQALSVSSYDGYERRFLQAVEGNRVIGIVSLVLGGKVAACYGLGVVTDTRKRGVGRALMDQITNDARAAGAERMFLQTESRSAVEDWYKRLGYSSLFDAAYLRKSVS